MKLYSRGNSKDTSIYRPSIYPLGSWERCYFFPTIRSKLDYFSSYLNHLLQTSFKKICKS